MDPTPRVPCLSLKWIELIKWRLHSWSDSKAAAGSGVEAHLASAAPAEPPADTYGGVRPSRGSTQGVRPASRHGEVRTPLPPGAGLGPVRAERPGAEGPQGSAGRRAGRGAGTWAAGNGCQTGFTAALGEERPRGPRRGWRRGWWGGGRRQGAGGVAPAGPWRTSAVRARGAPPSGAAGRGASPQERRGGRPHPRPAGHAGGGGGGGGNSGSAPRPGPCGKLSLAAPSHRAPASRFLPRRRWLARRAPRNASHPLKARAAPGARSAPAAPLTPTAATASAAPGTRRADSPDQAPPSLLPLSPCLAGTVGGCPRILAAGAPRCGRPALPARIALPGGKCWSGCRRAGCPLRGRRRRAVWGHLPCPRR